MKLDEVQKNPERGSEPAENQNTREELLDTRCCADVCCGAFSLAKTLSGRKKKNR